MMLNKFINGALQGVIERNLTTSAPVSSFIETTGLRSCDKVKAFSSSSFRLADLRKQDNSSESSCGGDKKDVYKVSPLCAPKGYRYKGIVPSLKCSPLCESTATEGVKAETPKASAAPSSAEAPVSTPSAASQAPPKAPGPAGLSPQLDGITPVKKDLKADVKEVRKNETKSTESSSVCEKKTNIFTKWLAKRKEKAAAKKECKKKKKIKKKQKKCKKGEKQVESTSKLSPSNSAKPVDTGKSAGGAKPEEIGKPAGGAKPEEIGKPAGGAKPGEIEKPACGAKPEEIGKPAGGTKPEEIGKPAGRAKSEEIGKPAGGAKLEEIGKPANIAKPVDSKTAAPSGEKPCTKEQSTNQGGKQVESSNSPGIKPSSSSVEQSCPPGQAKAADKQANPADGSGETKKTSGTIKSVAACVMHIHLFSTDSSSGKSSLSCPGDDSPSLKETPVKESASPPVPQEISQSASNQEGSISKGDVPCPPSVAPNLKSPQYSTKKPTSSPKKECPKHSCPRRKIKLPTNSCTEKSEKIACKFDLGCKTKRDSSATKDPSASPCSEGKAPCEKSRRELNEKCPDFKAFSRKESLKTDETCPKQPCSTLPWPFNVLQNLRKCKKAKKEKCKKIKEEISKQKKKDCQVQKCVLSNVPILISFNMSEAFMKSVLFGTKNIHTTSKFYSKPDCNGDNNSPPVCPSEKCTFRKCDLTPCDEKMEQEAKSLREKSRRVEKVKKPDYNICLFPPDSWEAYPASVSLTSEKKTKTDKVYEQPRFVSRKLRKSIIC